jgi:DNA-binding response OmpR family regulator
MQDSNPLRVLLVDDDRDTVFTWAKLVQFWGHDALTACNGEDALLLAKSFRPDVVLLDVGMPGMDGVQLAKSLLAMEELNGVQIVAISGREDLDTRTRAEQIGVHRYMLKPVKSAEIEKLLASLSAQLGK